MLVVLAALQFSQGLAYLDTAQQQVDTHLKAHSDMLKQVSLNLTNHLIKKLKMWNNAIIT